MLLRLSKSRPRVLRKVSGNGDIGHVGNGSRGASLSEVHVAAVETHQRDRISAISVLFVAFASAVAIALFVGGAHGIEEDETVKHGPEKWVAELYALDHTLNLYDFDRRDFGHSFQIDAELRDYVGDIHFDGERLALVQDYHRSGRIVDLGREKTPDDEFSMFYGLRLNRRRFEQRVFPYDDEFNDFARIDERSFFSRPDGTQLVTKIQVGHTYALRMAHPTRVEPGRVLVVRVIDFVPGVRVRFCWRWLEDRSNLRSE